MNQPSVPPLKHETRLIVVVPTLNERENLPELLPAIFHALPQAHVLIVDDASPDGTADWVAAQMAHEPRLHLLNRTGPKGLGRAYISGFEWALREGYDYVAQMDADGSHNPASLPTLLASLADADVAVGTRYMPGGALVNWPWYRKLLSRFAGFYVRLLTGLQVADPTSGFRCFRATALSALQVGTVRSEGYAFQVEVIHRARSEDMRIAECPIIFAQREHGYSKLSAHTIFEAVWMGVRLGRVNAHKWSRKRVPAIRGSNA